jgi:ribonuclease III
MGLFVHFLSSVFVRISALLLRSNFTKRNKMTIPQGPQPPPVALPCPLPDLPDIGDDLRKQVYTHAGAQTKPGPPSNKRLSVLGSKCLSASVATILFTVCDGKLTPKQINDLLNKYVSANTVGMWAREYRFHLDVHVVGYLHLDNKSTIPGDAFQAYLGATVLKFSQEHLTDFLRKLLEPELSQIDVEEDGRHDMIVQKLHERLTSLHLENPKYEKKENKAADELERFEVKCQLGGEIIGRGEGRSYKIAKCMAAKAAMRKKDKQLTMLKEKKESSLED